jgi:predicted alpha/beta hydrolase family esterase
VSQYLVLHGLDGSGPGHWQPWLVEALRTRGKEVAFPDLPDASDPWPDPWVATTRNELERGPDVVVCHSLACLLWLRLAAAAGERLANRVLLVAPPCRDDVEQVARFLDHGADSEAVARAAPQTLLVCSDNDPYCQAGAIATYAEPLEIESRLIAGAGHINPDAGYGPWPDCEEWALTARWP